MGLFATSNKKKELKQNDKKRKNQTVHKVY